MGLSILVIQELGKNEAGFMVALWTAMRKQEQKLLF